jgi:type I restriction enzyme S subunit
MDTKKLRQKILDLAIHGKLVPQDPNDEPASVLLERIRAEKERLIKEGKIKRSKKSTKTSDTPHYENVPFEIPEGWEWTNMESFTYDLQYGTSEKSLREGDVPVLRMGNITRIGTIDFADLVYSSNENDISKYTLVKDDLLFNRTNSSEWVGKTAIFKSDLPAIYAGYLIRVRCILVCPDFINYVLNSSYHRDWCNLVKTDAVNQSNINAQKLSKHLIPIPPYKEQLRIVAKTESWLKAIGNMEDEVSDLGQIISRVKYKILDLAIHGKLVPQDPNDEPAIELLKRINPSFSPCDNAHEKKDIPESWLWCSIQDTFHITMGCSPTGENLNRENRGIEFHQGKVYFSDKYIMPSGIYTTQSAKIAEAHSILLCVRAPVGSVNLTDRQLCIGRGLCSLQPFSNIDLFYGFYVLKTCHDELEQKATGSTFKAIGGDIIKNHLIPLPPYPEQLRIVAKIEELFAVFDKIASSLETKCQGD